MRKVILLFFILLIFLCGNLAMAQEPVVKPADRVVAYYFHGKFRCYTCTLMEQYIKEAIESNFKDALASGELEFKVVDVEQRGNEHYIKDYKLYTKALILSLVTDGKEARHKNLDKIWEYARDKRRFIDYVKEEVNGFLEEAR